MILLSIHPEYVAKILSKDKTFEFRKHVPANFDEDKRVAVYSTSPDCKIVCYFEVDSVLVGSPSGLWRRVSRGAGISKAEFDAYFNGRTKAFAYKISKVYPLKGSVTLKSVGWGSGAPQSFCYLSKQIIRRIAALVQNERRNGQSSLMQLN